MLSEWRSRLGQIHGDVEAYHLTRFPGHRLILEPLLAGFSVDRAVHEERGRTFVFHFHLRPDDYMREYCGIERDEVLLTYSPFDRLEARTVELHQNARSVDNRLDPLVSFLLCGDSATPERLAELVKADAPQIVGFSVDDIHNVLAGVDLRTLIADRVFSRDLFAAESPLLSDPTFFGRKEIVSTLVSRHRSGQNSGLFGLRRIGKTSVLHAVIRQLKQAEISNALYLDVSSPALYQQRWWFLLQDVVMGFCQLQGIPGPSESYSELDGAQRFRDDLLALFDADKERRWLLALDELEWITFGDVSPARHWEVDFLPFWQAIKALHQELRGRMTFIVAGINPAGLELARIGKYDNPLFETTSRFYLGFFEQDEIQQMVRRLGRSMGLSVESALYGRLFEEYGGHPYLTRRACSGLAGALRERPGSLTVPLFERERDAIARGLDELVSYILSVLASWYPAEFEALRRIAVEAPSSTTSQESSRLTSHLEGYGLVARDGSTLHIRTALIRNHLREAAESLESETNLSEEELAAQIMRRRYRLERALRTTVKDGIWFGCGDRAAAAALGCLQERRRENLSGLAYGELWEELTLYELLAILEGNWRFFQTAFGKDKADVITWLKHINKCRKDAHSNTVKPDDLPFLWMSFLRMEEVLKLPQREAPDDVPQV